MNILSQDIAEVAFAVDSLVKDSQAVQDIGANIEVAEPINEDPSRCPWIGIYPARCAFPSRAAGFGPGFRYQNPEVFIVCQEKDPLDGRACLDALGKLVKAVADAILSDASLKGTVQMMTDFEVEFSGYQKVNDAIMQTATIRVIGQTTVSGG